MTAASAGSLRDFRIRGGRMLGRALILATVMLWIGCFAADRALAQENLEAGKSPSQIFAGTCNACHKSPRGLLKTVPAGSLSSFLRQHYTTSPNMANVLASYLVSNGANDPKAAAAAKGAKEGAKEGTKEAKQEAKPANAAVEQLDRFGRKQHPTTASTAPQEPAPTAGERPPETQQPAQGKGSAKQKLTKRAKPGEEAPKEEPAATEPPKSENANVEPGKPESSPSSDGSSQSAKMEPPKETPGLRPDPVPPVTPAPSAPAAAAAPAQAPATPAPAAAAPPAQPPMTLPPPAVSAAASSSEPLPVMALPPTPPGVRASAPPLPPVPPAGPPVPPISQ
jgi:hypothetical protein